jgi:hypothetical protein
MTTTLEKFQAALVKNESKFDCDYGAAGMVWHINVYRYEHNYKSRLEEVVIVAAGDGPSIEAAMVDTLANMGEL